MSSSIASATVSRQRELADVRPRMAKADVRKPEIDTDYRDKVAKAFTQAVEPWSLGELSLMLKRDERQIARWKNGAERPQFDVLFACESLRARVLIALAGLGGPAVELETIVRIKVIA